MTERYLALNAHQHRNLKLLPLTDFEFVADQQLVPLTVNEFAKVCGHFAIVFVKQSDTGQLQPVAVMGHKPNSNRYVEQGQWQGHYLPQFIARHPFVVSDQANADGGSDLGIDCSSTRLSEEHGDPLFESNGEPAPALQQSINFINQLQRNQSQTQWFVEQLLALKLLQPKSMQIRSAEGNYRLDGVYLIDEAQLSLLDDQTLLRLAKNGIFAAIHFQLASLNQLSRLAPSPETMEG